MVTSMHEVSRHRELVVKKGARKRKALDPNTFPIQKLSGDFIQEYESVWDIERDAYSKRLERLIGHSLVLKDSSIDHHEAGRGVYVSCRR